MKKNVNTVTNIQRPLAFANETVHKITAEPSRRPPICSSENMRENINTFTNIYVQVYKILKYHPVLSDEQQLKELSQIYDPFYFVIPFHMLTWKQRDYMMERV